MREQPKPPMKPVAVKMPEWMLAALKHRAGHRGIAAYIRDLIVRDLSEPRATKAS